MRLRIAKSQWPRLRIGSWKCAVCSWIQAFITSMQFLEPRQTLDIQECAVHAREERDLGQGSPDLPNGGMEIGRSEGGSDGG